MKCLLLFFVVYVHNIGALENNLMYVIQNGIMNENQLSLRKSDLVRVDLYYESLCPDCRIFDNTQFANAIKSMGSYLDVHTYPYGNAKTTVTDGRVTITCQHGPPECYGNKLHGCAIDILGNMTQAVLYNSCMMDVNKFKMGSDDQAADVCGQLLQIDSGPIKSCAKSATGDEILYKNGEESKKVTYDGVPYVLINGVSSDPNNFIDNLCNSFNDPPPACKNRYLYQLSTSIY